MKELAQPSELCCGTCKKLGLLSQVKGGKGPKITSSCMLQTTLQEMVLFRMYGTARTAHDHMVFMSNGCDCGVEYLDNPLVTQAHGRTPGQIVAFVVCPVEDETKLSHILAVVKTCSFLHKKRSNLATGV